MQSVAMKDEHSMRDERQEQKLSMTQKLMRIELRMKVVGLKLRQLSKVIAMKAMVRRMGWMELIMALTQGWQLKAMQPQMRR